MTSQRQEAERLAGEATAAAGNEVDGQDDPHELTRDFIVAVQKRVADLLEPLLAGREWRSIDDGAPTDGTHVLLAFGQDWVSVGSYHRNDDDPHPWKFMDSQGQGLPIFNGARDDKYGPTHWQPLPTPLTKEKRING